MSSKFKITVRRSKDPSIEEYFAVVWIDGEIQHLTDYFIDRDIARNEARNWLEEMKEKRL